MKKLATLLTMLAAFCFLAQPAAAQSESVWEIGEDLVPVSKLADGMNIVLESSSSTNALGYYFPLPTEANGTSYLEGADFIDASTVWTIEATNTTNAKLSDAPQYILKNKQTGTYLSVQYVNVGTDSEDTYWFMVESAEEALKLSFFAPDDEVNGLINNTNDSWTSSSACIRFTLDASASRTDTLSFNSYWGRGYYLWSYRDTHVWNIYEAVEKTDGLSLLRNTVDSYGTTIDSYYVYGTNPGEINNEEAYNNFYEAYANAVDAIEKNNKTEEELQTLRTTLIAAKAAIDNPDLINELTDGYYYLVTACQYFSANKAMTYALGANYLQWNTLAEDNLAYIWEIHKVDSGYSVQNVATSVYLDKAVAVGASQKVCVANTFTTPTVFLNLNAGGVFHISDTTDYASTYPFHMESNADGAGSNGDIVLWRAGLGSASAWYVRRVSDEMAAQIEAGKGITRLETQLAASKTSVSGASKNIGTLVGQWPETAITALQNLIAEAEALIAAGGTNDEYIAMADKLQAQREATAASRNKVQDGKYYAFVSSYDEYLKQQNVEKAICSMIDRFEWRNYNDTCLSFIFQATANEDGTYYFQNVSTKKYMGKAENANNSATVYQSDDPVAIQLVNFNDSVYDFKVMPTATNRQYHTASHSNGAGIRGYLVNWNSDSHGASAWYVREISPDVVTKANFTHLMDKAESKAEAIYAYEPDLSQPVVTSVSQFSSNNMEPNEGTYAALIDGDDESLRMSNGQMPFYHSAWSNPSTLVDEYHNLCVDAGEGKTIPEKFILTMTHRTTQGNRCRPRIITISVSNDNENWTDLTTISHNVDVQEPINDYVSPEINAGGSYRYAKMTVIATTGREPNNEYTGETDKYGHQWFAISEFNIYPSNGLSAAAQVNDASVKAAADVLNAAIAKAHTTYASGTITDADFDELQAAIDAFDLVWKDTTLYTAKVAEVNIFKENLVTGTEVGQVTAEALATFEAEIAEPASISPVYKLSKTEMESAIAKLDEALAKVKAAMVMPDSKTWYFITSADANADNSTTGWFVMQYGRTEGTNMYNNTLDDPSEHINNVWIFENDGAGKFYIRNVGSGMYQKASEPTEGGNITNAGVTGALPEAESFSLIPLGSDQFAFKSNAGNYYIYANATAGGAVTWQTPDVTDLTDTKYAFEFTEVMGVTGEMPRPFSGIRLGQFAVLTMPTALAYTPQATIGGDENNVVNFEVYEITGKTVNEEGSITAIKLSKVTTEEPVVEAGKPFILYAPGNYADNITTDQFSLSFTVDGEVAQAQDDSINGLIGTMQPRTISNAIMATFSGDSIAPVTSETTFANQRGYIDPTQITEVEGATNDLIVYVKGAGILNNIENIIEVVDNREIVDVYTTDGILVKKNVTRGTAVNGLAKGVYIVGKQKVLVK